MKGLFKDTAIYALADFLFKFVSFAVFPLFTYALTVSEFGLVSLLTTFAVLMSTVWNCGQEQAVHRFFFDSQLAADKKGSVIMTGLFLLLSFSAAGLALCLTLSWFFQSAIFLHFGIGWEELALASLWAVPLQVVNYMQAVIRSSFKPWKFSFFSAMQNTLAVAVPLYLTVVLQKGVAGYISGVLLASVATSGLGVFFIKQQLHGSFDRVLAREMIRFGFPFIFTGLAFWIFGSMDRWMLGDLSGSAEVGIYSVAFRIGSVLTFLIYAFNGAWTPHALKLNGSHSNCKEIYSRCFTIWFYLMILAGAFLSLFGSEVLFLLTPKDYWGAYSLLPFICFGLSLYGTTAVTSIGITISKKTASLFFLSGIAAVLNFVLNYWLIPPYGALGAALATFVCNGLLTAGYLIASQRLYPIPLEKSKLVVCLILLFLALAFSVWINRPIWLLELFLVKITFFCFLIAAGLGANLLDVRSIYQSITSK